VSGFIRQGNRLFYTVFTPVYVQSSREPLLLNVLCAAFKVDTHLASELKELAPNTDFVFASQSAIFGSTASSSLSLGAARRHLLPGYVLASEKLRDVAGAPVADLFVVHSYGQVLRSLHSLQRAITLAWVLTMIFGLLLSSYVTKRLLYSVKLLDVAARRFAARDYNYRVPVRGSGELPRLARTFNAMCDSIQQAQADLVRQEQMATIARLGSSLVHDLRNPLAAIYGGAEMLIDNDMPPEQVTRIARNIHRASQRMQDLLRDLLHVSKAQSRALEFCDLRDIVDAAIESVTVRPNVDLQVDIPQQTEVLCDRMRVERVFTNLFSNALDAMPLGGKISLHAKATAQGLDVVVEDSGPGVPEQIRPTLFQPFVTGKRSGMGLGLALSKQTMVEAGGDLQLIDSNGSSGARFRLQFARVKIPTR
jgi:signal transduction histidine kinase